MPYQVMSEDSLYISVGYEQSSGDYGLENNTDISKIPLTFNYINDALRFRVEIPYIRVKSDGSVIPSSTAVTTTSGRNISGSGHAGSMITTTGSPVTTQSGLGDIITSASYAFMPTQQNVFYELTAEVKWGTASTRKNLGTGENDYSLSLYTMYDKHDVMPFVSLGYLIIGDTSTINYDDVLFTTLGLNYQWSEKTLISVAYDYQQASVENMEDGKVVNFYINKALNRDWSVNFNLLTGFSDSVADSGVGIALSMRL